MTKTQKNGGPRKTRSGERWYDAGVVVELLIHETPRGERCAPEIGNLCIGFTSLTLDKLVEEIEDMRACWPFIFPKTLQTEEIRKLIERRYPKYEEILAPHSVTSS